MINDLLNEKKNECKRYLVAMAAYVFFEIACLVLVNTLMTNFLPAQRDFRHLALYIILLVLVITFYMISRKKTVVLMEGIVSDMRERIIEKVRHTELESFEKMGRSRVYNAITLDTRAISDTFDMLMVSIEITLLSVCIVAYLAVVNDMSFLFVAGIFVLGSAFYYYQIIRFKMLIHKAREKEKELFDSTEDFLYGFKELRVNQEKSDDFFRRSFKEKTSLNRIYRVKAEKELVKSNIVSSFFEFIVFVPILFILPALKDVPGSTIMITITMILFIPFNALKETVPPIVRAWVSVERISALGNDLEKISVESDGHVDQDQIKKFGEITYSGLEFKYTDIVGRPLFSVSGINFSVYPGEIIFITGGNGSGKSTLLKMLIGLYFPHSGRVEVDGLKIENMASIRSLFSVIFDDFHLFDRLFGISDIDSDKVKKWIGIMELEHKVQFEDGRFTTLDLSSGEKKRLGMVAAVMEDKPIYILDEWAAEQSPHFRNFFYESLLPGLKELGKTVIAVTHDDLYFSTADRVLKLDHGKLVKS